MLDGPIPIRTTPFLRSPPAIQKVKRGGTGKVSSSGNAARRQYTAPRAVRDKTGKHLPWPAPGKIIWEPGIECPPRAPARHRTFTSHIVTAPRPDPIYARKRRAIESGLTRAEIKREMAARLGRA